MKFSRLFYDSRVSFNKIPINWIIISVVVGLLSALTIYNFFYVIRESFRVMTFGFANLPYTLTEEDRNSYNLFFAGLSVIFANSITINMLLSRPSNILSWRNPIRRRIVNDQVFLNFNFTYWFTKMGLCFFVFSMCCLDFDFSPYVGVLSTLLLLVLYFDSWKGLIRIFHRNRFKVQTIHFGVMLFLTFGLSKINTVNYKSIDKAAVESSPVYALPHSNFYDEFQFNNNPEVTINLELLDNGKLEIWYYGDRVTFYDIPSIIAAERASMREELIPYLYVRISADRSLQIKHVKTVEKILYDIGQRNIIYNIYNEDLLSHRFEKRGVKFKISHSIKNFNPDLDFIMPPSPQIEVLLNYSQDFKDTLKVNIGTVIKLNDSITYKNDLVKKFKTHIASEILFEYSYEKECVLQDYISVLSSHKIAVNELRKQNQIIFKKDKWDNSRAYRNEQNKLKLQFPTQLTEKFN